MLVSQLVPIFWVRLLVPGSYEGSPFALSENQKIEMLPNTAKFQLSTPLGTVKFTTVCVSNQILVKMFYITLSQA